MKHYSAIALSIMLSSAFFLSACGTENAQEKKPEISVPVASQRFVPVTYPVVLGAPALGSLALDTHTGQLCQTYAASKDGPAWAVSLPRCIDLYSDTDKTLALERSRNSLDKEILDAAEAVKKSQKQK